MCFFSLANLQEEETSLEELRIDEITRKDEYQLMQVLLFIPLLVLMYFSTFIISSTNMNVEYALLRKFLTSSRLQFNFLFKHYNRGLFSLLNFYIYI